MHRVATINNVVPAATLDRPELLVRPRRDIAGRLGISTESLSETIRVATIGDVGPALAKFDFEDTTAQQRASDLATVLDQSRPRDALTLWHLLSRAHEDQRARVYDRLKTFVPPPAGVTRDGILHLDQPMLDLWWNALGFDDISVWRHWEHSWSDASKAAGTKETPIVSH